MGLRELLDKIFPTDEGRHKTNELVERGLEALRSARDEQSFTMGDVTRVPSRLELRLPQERFDALKAMEAARDLQFFFTDELMKDLAAENMRTFGDHAVHVTVAVDPSLGPDEIYATVLAPEHAPERPRAHSMGAPAINPDSTRVLGGDAPATVAVDAPSRAPSVETYRLVIVGPGGFRFEERLEGRQWIIGRRGSSGKPLPAGYRKIDVDFRETVSRDQLRLDLYEEKMRVQRIGKAPVTIARSDALGNSEDRMLALGTSIQIDEYEVIISR